MLSLVSSFQKFSEAFGESSFREIQQRHYCAASQLVCYWGPSPWWLLSISALGSWKLWYLFIQSKIKLCHLLLIIKLIKSETLYNSQQRHTIQELILSIFNKYQLIMNSNQLIICLFVIIVAATRQPIWIKYEALRQESDVFHKYFNRMKYGYFVDLGGFNPIQQSNTVRFSNWNGIIVEANEKRSTNIRDFQPHITSLNFAVSNVSGEMATFYEADFTQASSLSQTAITKNNNMGYKEQKVMVIDMADLCHKYYKTKPNLLNIDVEGIGQIVLRANDWKTEKCVPDIIYAEDANQNVRAGYVNLQQVVLSHNYTKVEYVVSSSLFIHNSKLEFYKNQALANAQYVSNKILYQWNDLSSGFTTLLGKRFDQQFDSRTNPAYPFFRQLSLIDIVQINKYSNLISDVGPNRPIIIMQYDEKISEIVLGTNKYNIQPVNVHNKFNFKKITADYEASKLIIYVFDHQKYDTFNVRIAGAKQKEPCPIATPASTPIVTPTTTPNMNPITTPKEITNIGSNNNPAQEEQEKSIISYFKQLLIIILSLIIVVMLVLLWRIQKRLTSKSRVYLSTAGPQSDVKQMSSTEL